MPVAADRGTEQFQAARGHPRRSRRLARRGRNGRVERRVRRRWSAREQAMIDPVATQHIMMAAIAGALVILFGASYALLFALSRLRGRPALMVLAYGAYALLVGAVAVLAFTLNLRGAWQAVVAVMVIGYFLAPRLIWHLCAGTHTQESGHG
jgi:Flp pilus assembly protein TadB